MANEIQAAGTSGATLYAVVLSATGQFANGATPEAFNGAHWTSYAVTLTEQGTSGVFLGDFPALPAGAYAVVAKQRAGGSPAQLDDTVGVQSRLDWSGTAVMPLPTVTGGGVTLADGVAHGGTPGSSTATISCAAFNATNSAGVAFTCASTGGNGDGILASGHGSGAGLHVVAGASYGAGLFADGGPSSGIGANFRGGSVAGSGIRVLNYDASEASVAIHAFGLATGMTIDGDSGGLSILSASGYGVNIGSDGPVAGLHVSGQNNVAVYLEALGNGFPSVLDDSVACYGALADQTAAVATTVDLTGLTLLPATANLLNGSRVRITKGTAAGQERVITAWDGTAIATVDRDWVTQPAAGDTAVVYAGDAAKVTAALEVTAGDVTGKVLGGGSGTITGAGARAQASVPKNTAYPAFPFLMVDAAGNPATGLTVTGTRSIDGGAFAGCANAVVEVSGGWYKIDLAASDLNGASVAFHFAAPGARPLDFTILTAP